MKILRFLSMLILVSVLAACGRGIPNTGGAVRVGSKNLTENKLVAEMYAQVLADNGIAVERKFDLAGTQGAHNALVNHEIDLYPEYTSTAYLSIMEMKDGEKDPGLVREKVRKYYERRWKITWLEPAPLSNTTAIAVTADAANKYNLRTLSDLVRAAPNLRFAAENNFQQRPDGLPGLVSTYGNVEFQSMNLFTPGSQFQALQSGEADVVVANSTDGQVRNGNLFLLQDDRGLWGENHITPVVWQEVLERYPQLDDVLNELSAKLTTEAMSELNWKVDGENQNYEQVAVEFLRQNGLLR